MNDEKEVKSELTSLNTSFSSMGQEIHKHDILDVLSRPINLGTFNWLTTTAVAAHIADRDVKDVLKNVNNAYKLIGYRYFRADFEFTLYINAQPFQQGAVLMYYFPTDPSGTSFTQMDNLTGKTGMISEVGNIEDDAPVRLVVPFNHPHGFYDLVSHVGSLGKIFVDVYSKLVSISDPATVTFTLFGRLINIKLMAPTDDQLDATIMPTAQMGEAEKIQKEGVVTQISGAVSTIAKNLSNVPYLGVVARPISWISAAVHKISSIFGWSKPGSVATTDVNKLTVARYMANYNGIDTSNSLGLDAGNALQNYAFFGNDEMILDDIISNLCFHKTFAWKTSDALAKELTKIKVSPVTGRIKELKSDSAHTGNNYHKFPPMPYISFVASMFRFWHGNMRFQLRIIKTKFHSGRLLIKWVPGSTSGTTLATTPMAYTIIWDVAKSNTIAFDIPYMNPKPWLMMITVDDQVQVAENSWKDYKNGVVHISVLNKLMAASATVKDEVEIIVEMAGAPGFSFAHPIDPRIRPISSEEARYPTGGTVPTVRVGSAVVSKPVRNNNTRLPVAQIGKRIINKDKIQSLQRFMKKFYPSQLMFTIRCCYMDATPVAQIGTPVALVDFVAKGEHDEGLEPEKLSIGEKVFSLRQLIKRFYPVQLWGNIMENGVTKTTLNPSFDSMKNCVFNGISQGNVGLDNLVYDFANFNPMRPQYAEGVTLTPTLPRHVDMLTTLTCIFAYWRGSIRTKIIPLTSDVQTSAAGRPYINSIMYRGQRPADVENLAALGVQDLISNSSATSLGQLSLEGVVETELPFYQKVAFAQRVHAEGNPTQYYQQLAVIDKADEKYKFLLWRAAGDDFDAFFKIGVPAMQHVPYHREDTEDPSD